VESHEDDAQSLGNSLNNLQDGLYSYGTSTRKATKEEKAEIIANVPEEALTLN
jgi:hypothetical protein